MIAEGRLIRAQPSFGLLAKLRRINWTLVLLLCALAGVGYVALYSAAGGAPEPYASRHILRFGIGLAMMLGIGLIDIRFVARLSWPVYGVSVGLLALVLRIGHVGKGAQRWLELGGMQVQPSELAKVGLVMALAAWFRRASWAQMGNPLFLFLPALLVVLPVGLILKEPNLGTAVIVGLVGAAMFLAAGVRWWLVALVLLPTPFAARFAFDHMHDYQRARITTFLNPESDPLGAGYNIIQSKIAMGSGGLWGKGFLHGTQGQLDFLPEKQTDFIFTTLAEEFGLVGGLAVMGLLAGIVCGGMMVALRCRHRYGRLLALGISANFFMYAFVNLAMALGAIPVGGVPLPLVSHGGSAMLMAMFGFGLLMSVHVHRDAEFAEGRDD